MKNLLSFAFLFVALHFNCSAAGFYEKPDSSIYGVLLPRGTEVPLCLSNPLVLKDLNEGDMVSLHVLHDIVVADKKVVIKAHAQAWGKVVRLQKRGIFGRPGIIEIEPMTVRNVDGNIISIESDEPWSFKGADRQAFAWGISLMIPAAGFIITCPYLFPVIGAGFLIKGKDAAIPFTTHRIAYTNNYSYVK